MIKVLLLVFLTVYLEAEVLKNLTLDNAIEILNSQNLEIKTADLEVKAAQEKTKEVSGMNWGKLNFVQNAARSDDALSAFGFKLSSRKATFGDFGFSDFSLTNPNILSVEPKDLNYPKDQNFFQTKLEYEVPLFTGFKISSYEDIMKNMEKLKTLDREKVKTEKLYELKKSFYDMGMLEASLAHMNIILDNINRLEDMTKEMIKEGYAKKVDLLEVQAKKADVTRVITQLKANKKLLYQYISFLLNQKVESIIPPKKAVKMPDISDEEALNANLDLQKAQEGLKITDSMLKVSRADLYYPVIGFKAEVASSDDKLWTNLNKHKSYTVGLQLKWNIFNGGSDYAKEQRAKIEKLKISSKVELAKKGIALKIAKIKTNIQTLNSQISSLKKELELADAIYKNYEGRYKEKLVSMNDVIIKQSEQIKKVLELLMAQNKRTKQIFELKKIANYR